MNEPEEERTQTNVTRSMPDIGFPSSGGLNYEELLMSKTPTKVARKKSMPAKFTDELDDKEMSELVQSKTPTKIARRKSKSSGKTEISPEELQGIMIEVQNSVACAERERDEKHAELQQAIEAAKAYQDDAEARILELKRQIAELKKALHDSNTQIKELQDFIEKFDIPSVNSEGDQEAEDGDDEAVGAVPSSNNSNRSPPEPVQNDTQKTGVVMQRVTELETALKFQQQQLNDLQKRSGWVWLVVGLSVLIGLLGILPVRERALPPY
eukprot:c2093_g1_i1.p1 GENE.c2093_g1_i1~~c2093_g1_i1.p1  ORF type:complete len:268 (+),score=55.22 c2093_g1_i1:57-860(+)